EAAFMLTYFFHINSRFIVTERIPLPFSMSRGLRGSFSDNLAGPAGAPHPERIALGVWQQEHNGDQAEAEQETKHQKGCASETHINQARYNRQTDAGNSQNHAPEEMRNEFFEP